MAFKATQAWYAGAALGAVGVLAVGYLALVSPQISSAADVTAQKNTVTAANDKTELQIALLKRQFSTLPDLEAKVASMRVHLPTSPQEPTLLRQISALASDTHITLVSVQVSPPQATSSAVGAAGTSVQTPGTLSQIGLNLQVTGSFANTRSFLNKLENLPRFVLVSGLNITRQGGSSTPATGSSSSSNSDYTLSTSITARTFMVGDQTGGGTTTASTTPAAGTTGTAS